MYNNSKVAKAIRVAMMFGAGAAAAISAPTFAAEEGVEEVERIQVTGSRLKRTDMESASPITVVTAEQLKVQGIQDVGQFLQSSAVMSGSPAMTTTNNGGNGGTFVELRGLGSSRTLVLVNGRRQVSSDFQSIPASMIQRIEILKDGASATYGADAVAGVVNIITRRDFEGVEFNFQQSGSFNVGENNQTSTSLVMGKAFDGGHLVFGVDYVKQDAVYQGDVTDVDFFNHPWQVWGQEEEENFAKYGMVPPGSPNASVENFGSGSVPCGQFYMESRPNQINNTCDGGIASLADMRDFVNPDDTYNYAPVNYLQTPYEKLNFFVEGSFELNDNVAFYTETRLNHRTSRQELAAVPYDTRYDPAYKGTLPDGSAFNGVSKDNFYNPFGEDVTRSRRRMLEGGRSFEQDITRIQQVIGMEGQIGDNWSYDLNYNYGYSQTASTDFGQLFGPNLAKAMGPSFKNDDGDIVCGTAEAPIAGCVSMNVFGGPGSVSKEMLEYVTAPLVDASNYTLQTLTGFIGGDVFELPAGAIAGGIGFEYRKEELEQQVDSGKFMGEVTGNKSKGVSGDFDVISLFTEIRIPVLSDLPGVESLEIPIGVRYDDFSNFGSSTTYQLGLEWNVMDGLLVRGTYGTVFRAPSINSLFSPMSDSFPSAVDPCNSTAWGNLTSTQQGNCMADGVPSGGSANLDGQQLAQVGGNPDLQPEEGDTFTVGLAYSPEFIDGLGMTLDYWSIELEKVHDSIGASDSLQGCYLGGVAGLCENIERTNGELSLISAQTQNLSAMTAKGIDFEASYNFEALGGDFHSILSWTHFLERENQVYNGNDFVFEMQDLTGEFENDTSYAADKINFTLAYSIDDLTISYVMNYIGDMTYDELTYDVYWREADAPDYVYDIEAMFYHDISASYTLDTGTTFAAGVTNLTDEKPPYIETGANGNTDESNYRLFGRSWFLRFTQKF
ncbi:TonB-dependent receptor [Colwellia sp. 75C3]|uniref:TonB-dependent receptor domain-containing protein n=1 Tax=Colwellia sp. 75C3 TaxID=888425 RepID=UPI000C34FAD6|nr:TonB-dependent receptor [Colwellia sp. 75C3]PKG85918.1 TonB-dependent receptor [Colwellia sp. 75C3]